MNILFRYLSRGQRWEPWASSSTSIPRGGHGQAAQPQLGSVVSARGWLAPLRSSGCSPSPPRSPHTRSTSGSHQSAGNSEWKQEPTVGILSGKERKKKPRMPAHAWKGQNL